MFLRQSSILKQDSPWVSTFSSINCPFQVWFLVLHWAPERSPSPACTLYSDRHLHLTNSSCYGKTTEGVEEKVLSDLSLLWLRLHMGYKGPTEVKHHLSLCWGCPLYQNSSLVTAEVKSPSVEWMPSRNKRPRDDVFQPCTHQMQPCVTRLMDANTCGNHFMVTSPPGGWTEPGTLGCSMTTCIPPSPAKDLWESERFA